VTEQTTHSIGTIEINGRSFPATFNTRGGIFTADVDGRSIGSQTYEGLIERVKVEERRTRVKVEVAFVDPATGKRGVATGLHATRRTPLIRWNGGGSAQDDVREPLLPDTNVARLRELHQAERDAARALREFQERNRLGPHTLSRAVQEAIEQAAQQGSETP
jgi:hypothetical protein